MWTETLHYSTLHPTRCIASGPYLYACQCKWSMDSVRTATHSLSGFQHHASCLVADSMPAAQQCHGEHSMNDAATRVTTYYVRSSYDDQVAFIRCKLKHQNSKLQKTAHTTETLKSNNITDKNIKLHLQMQQGNIRIYMIYKYRVNIRWSLVQLGHRRFCRVLDVYPAAVPKCLWILVLLFKKAKKTCKV